MMMTRPPRASAAETMTMTTDVLVPFFVGGALHGYPVPPGFLDKNAVEARAITGSTIYLRTIWWRDRGRSFYIYVRDEMPVEDMTALVEHHLRAKGWT